MPFALVAPDRIKSNLIQSIKTLIEHHNPSHQVDPDNLKDSIVLLAEGSERRMQADWILKIIALTDPLSVSTEQDRRYKAGILNAAAYYVRDKIAKTYNYAGPERSTFYKTLTTSLAIDEANKPGPNDVLVLYRSLKRFLCKHVYTEGEAAKGYLVPQVFAIKGYAVEDDIIDLVGKIAEKELEQIRDARLLQQRLVAAQAAPSAPSGGLFNLFSRAPAPKVADEDHKQQQQQLAPQ